MKRNPNPPRMFCSFFFSHFHTFNLSHSPTNTPTHTEREKREKREKRDVCAIALIPNKGAAIQGGVGWGEKERNTYTRMAMDGCAALRCNGCAAMGTLQWMRCAAMEWKWVGILLLLFLVSCCLKSARAPDRCCCCCYCWLLAVQVHNSNAMQWN